MIESYPIYHRDYFFNIITHLDLEFSEVRKLLDRIMEVVDPDELLEVQGVSMDLETERFLYHVEIYGYEIVVTSRTPSAG